MPESLLRLATLAVLILVVAGVGVVGKLHYKAWRRLPREAGLTPLHVTLVSLGVLIWGVALAWAQLDALAGITDPGRVLVRAGMFFVGGVIILLALAVVGGLQRRRVQFSRSEKVVVSSAETVAVDDERRES